MFQDVSGVGIPMFQLEDLFKGIKFPPKPDLGTVYIIRELSSSLALVYSIPSRLVLACGSAKIAVQIAHKLV